MPNPSNETLVCLLPGRLIARLVEVRTRRFRDVGYPQETARREAVGSIEREVEAMREERRRCEEKPYEAMRSRIVSEAMGMRGGQIA